MLRASNQITVHRHRLRLSLRECGERAEIDFRRLHLAEQGLRLRPAELLRLAQVLNVEPAELLEQQHEAEL